MRSVALYSPEPAKGWLPWGAFAPILGLLFVAAPVIAFWSLEEHFHLVDAQGNPTGLPGWFFFLVVEFGVTGLAVLAWVRFVERRPFATLGLVQSHRARTFLRGLAIGVATSSGVVAAIWLAGGYSAAESATALGSPRALSSIAFLLVCFAVQSSVEEIVFRGWLLSAVARKLNVPLAVAITTALFTFLHFEPHQPWRVTLGIVLFSLFTCAWALKTGNVWGVMGWHSGWNWLLAVGFQVPITGLDVKLPALLVHLTPMGTAALTGGAQGPEGSFLCALFFAGAITFLLGYRPHRPAPSGTSAPAPS